MGKLPDDYRPAHEPYQIDTTAKLEKLQNEIIGAIRDGLPVRDAFILAGIPMDTYYRWVRECKEDLADGYTGTNLIMLMQAVAREDKRLFRNLSKAMMEEAIDNGNVRMQMYLADNRFGYANRRKNILDMNTGNKGETTINIVNMTSVDDDVETTEVEEIEVHGECRDDSDTTELD